MVVALRACAYRMCYISLYMYISLHILCVSLSFHYVCVYISLHSFKQRAFPYCEPPCAHSFFRRVVNELLDTERSYVKDLKIVVEV